MRALYISFAEYQQVGGKLGEEAFNERLPLAESMLDDWTLNRLRNAQVMKDAESMGDWPRVKMALKRLIEQADAVRDSWDAKAAGAEVSSFSNGVNSFSFAAPQAGGSGMTAAEEAAYNDVVRLLPVYLTSACVSYNHAG